MEDLGRVSSWTCMFCKLQIKKYCAAQTPHLIGSNFLGSQFTCTVGIGYPTMGSSRTSLITRYTQTLTPFLPFLRSVACLVILSVFLLIVQSPSHFSFCYL